MAYATREGVRTYYEQAGEGAPAFVFVHGWCCDHTFFAPQYEHFGARGSVTTYDLRGCGRSDRTEDYEIATLADDLGWLCAELEISKPVVVGHSLGGGGSVWRFSPPAIRPSPGPSSRSTRGPSSSCRSPVNLCRLSLPGSKTPAEEDPRHAYVPALFRPSDDQERAKRIADTMCAVPRSIAAAQLNGYLRWDGVAALTACTVPLLVLMPETGGSNDPARLLALKPDLHVGVTVGAAHFHQLDAAEQVTPMIERFVRETTDPRARSERTISSDSSLSGAWNSLQIGIKSTQSGSIYR